MRGSRASKIETRTFECSVNYQVYSTTDGHIRDRLLYMHAITSKEATQGTGSTLYKWDCNTKDLPGAGKRARLQWR